MSNIIEKWAEIKTIIESIDLEWLDGLEDASPVGNTEMQKLPEDSSELAKEYGETHAAEGQDWWLQLREVYKA